MLGTLDEDDSLSPSLCRAPLAREEGVEQSQMVEASLSMPCLQTPLLSCFFTAASPATASRTLAEAAEVTPARSGP